MMFRAASGENPDSRPLHPLFLPDVYLGREEEQEPE